MLSSLSYVGVGYFVCVALFYHNSNGFTKFFNEYYCLWKILPIVFLSIFTQLHGFGLNGKTLKLQVLGIVLGGLGDWLIGASHEGIVAGAIFFGLGHICYMANFVPGSFALPIFLSIACLVWGLITNQLCLVPMIEEHPIAVGIMMIYSIFLTLAFLISYVHYTQGTKQCKAGHLGLCYRLLGFALFYVSDNVLIFHHVGFQIPYAEFIILGTYYSAQFLILAGLVHCEADKTKIKSK